MHLMSTYMYHPHFTHVGTLVQRGISSKVLMLMCAGMESLALSCVLFYCHYHHNQPRSPTSACMPQLTFHLREGGEQ